MRATSAVSAVIVSVVFRVLFYDIFTTHSNLIAVDVERPSVCGLCFESQLKSMNLKIAPEFRFLHHLFLFLSSLGAV